MIWFPCPKACDPGPNQYVWRDNGDTAHEHVGTRAGDDMLHVECGNCNHAHWIPREVWDQATLEMDQRAYRRKAGLTKYPYVDPFSGVEVKSKEHREDVWRAHGFHKAEHGINESFDDEACDNLRRKRQALEARRLATKRKREDYIRQGILKPKRPEPKRA